VENKLKMGGKKDLDTTTSQSKVTAKDIYGAQITQIVFINLPDSRRLQSLKSV